MINQRFIWYSVPLRRSIQKSDFQAQKRRRSRISCHFEKISQAKNQISPSNPPEINVELIRTKTLSASRWTKTRRHSDLYVTKPHILWFYDWTIGSFVPIRGWFRVQGKAVGTGDDRTQAESNPQKPRLRSNSFTSSSMSNHQDFSCFPKEKRTFWTSKKKK